jgi:hypothetical protein
LAKQAGLFLVILVLFSCEDEPGLVGFQNPNQDFQFFEKEFTIPTKVFLMDSLATSNGSNQNETKRIMVGAMADPRFGKTSATAYTQYWATGYPSVINSNAVVEKLTLTLIYDYYWQGNSADKQETYQVYEVTDSILTYLPHYSHQPTPYGPFLGQGVKFISPALFDESYAINRDEDTSNNVKDSLHIDLDPELGRRLLAAAMDTTGNREIYYAQFRKFRQAFKGLAIEGPGNDRIVGFNPYDAKSRMTLFYRIDTTKYQLNFNFSSPGESNISEYMNYTQFKTDRSGTPLAGLQNKYVDYEPSDGYRYIQGGTGVALKLDFTEVRDHFKNIPIKALSVAELRIETEQQGTPPTNFFLRALKPNNRAISATKGTVDIVGDPITILDTEFLSKHAVLQNTIRVEPVHDLGNIGFTLDQKSNEAGTALYIGYLTTFLQTETNLNESDFLRYFALIPQLPDVGKSVNGFYFPADKIKLKIYYTTPGVQE